MANMRPRIRTATLNLRLHPGERKALELIGHQEGIGTLSDISRLLIREGIERRGMDIVGMSPEDLAVIDAILAKYQ